MGNSGNTEAERRVEEEKEGAVTNLHWFFFPVYPSKHFISTTVIHFTHPQFLFSISHVSSSSSVFGRGFFSLSILDGGDRKSVEMPW